MAQNQVIDALANRIRQQAYIQAFNDCFYLIGFALLVSGIAILFFKKTRTAGISARH
ncbi:hypothetical protein [Leptolyngbya sp. FACHB-17]|uniref:hypothetical protein n=1 Tax=unclassified Leptolyngbya TaxID=2650499 RepID=UPI0016816703|nr:hypothetical protein [Leptolyngbya sp. FACHB-17]MBD2083066.1 hypothetical protein [Leptolyngbya sp. FACHB-17]